MVKNIPKLGGVKPGFLSCPPLDFGHGLPYVGGRES